MSSSDVFAEPMLDTDDYLKEYAKQLTELREKGQLPDLKKNLTYKVYSLQGSSFGAHKSIVLTADDKRFFTVELGFITVNGKKRIYPVTRAIPESMKSKMEYHGELNTTGSHLIGSAVAMMKKFGSYFKLCNNCQDYCNLYVEAIGMKNAQRLTSGDKAAILALVAGIVAFLFAMMRG